MRSRAAILLRYRALDGCRALRARHAGVWGAARIAANAAAPPLLLFLVGGLYRRTVPRLPAADGALPGAACLLALASAAAVGLIAFFEIFREIAFAPDRAHAAAWPLSDGTALLYRLGAASWRVLPYLAALALAPLALLPLVEARALAWALPLFVLLLAFAVLAALVLAVALAAACGISGASTHLVYSASYAAAGAGTAFLLWSLGPSRVTALAPVPWTPAGAEVAWAAASLVLLGGAALGAAVRLWPRASAAPSRPRGGALAAAILPAASFSRRWPRAVLQKDLRDLARNPAHRHAVAALAAVLLIGLWASARRGGQSPYGLLMLALNLLVLAPLVFSARTAGSERGMIDFYRLVLPRAGDLLALKLRSQTPFNALAAAAAAAPLFVLSGSASWPAAACFAASAAVLAPTLTALALALATLFPEPGDGPSTLGMKPRGVAAYLAAALPLYAFILEAWRRATPLLLAAAAACALAAAALAAVLFAAARRRLERG